MCARLQKQGDFVKLLNSFIMRCVNSWCALLCCLVASEIVNLFFYTSVLNEVSQRKSPFLYVFERVVGPLTQSSFPNGNAAAMSTTNWVQLKVNPQNMSSLPSSELLMPNRQESELTDSLPATSAHIYQLVLFTTEDVVCR